MKPIFNFNHVSEKLTNKEINELKAYYKTYHEKCWIYKKAYKKYRKWKIIENLASIIFASGGLASAIATSGIVWNCIVLTMANIDNIVVVNCPIVDK